MVDSGIINWVTAPFKKGVPGPKTQQGRLDYLARMGMVPKGMTLRQMWGKK